MTFRQDAGSTLEICGGLPARRYASRTLKRAARAWIIWNIWLDKVLQIAHPPASGSDDTTIVLIQ